MDMIVCNHCKNKVKPECKGDGECKKHGKFSFYMHNLKESCTKCAKEKNICQICGESLAGENKLNTNQNQL